MAMTAIDRIIDLVSPYVLGCPSPQIKLAIIESARQFCERTKCWKENASAGVTSVGVTDYPITLPDQSEDVALEGVTIDGRDLTLGISSGSASDPTFYASPGWGSVRITPTPTVAGKVIVASLALQPAATATQLPDLLVGRYGASIADGAIGRLMAQPGKQWSNPQLSAFYTQRFEIAADKGYIAQVQGRAVGDLVIKPRRFGRA